MSPKPYFAYIRISDTKQKQGVSLEEQRREIGRFSQSRGFTIAEWFVEVQTAAKAGRPVFDNMLRRIKKGDARGVVMHKIDRSARNLEDWLEINKLVDAGVDVQYAYEPIDLQTTSGRFSADILAVSAAHYIRNLRDESRKGFYGRLRQGIYPLPAPVGYLNQGKGKAKAVDPVLGPHVRFAFERYATGLVSIQRLCEELRARGWHRKDGRAIRKQKLADTFHNPFYYGLMRIESTGEMFQGVHTPLISKATFERVQAVMLGKAARGTVRHDYLFRRLLKCSACKYGLTGERQKGRVYYRCHTSACEGASIREDAVDGEIRETFARLRLAPEDIGDVRDLIREAMESAEAEKAQQIAALRLHASQIEKRLNRLTDALLDCTIDKDAFNRRKAALLQERAGFRERLDLPSNIELIADRVTRYFELGITAYSRYDSHNPDEMRRAIEKLTSNRLVHGKTPAIALKSPYREIVEDQKLHDCAPHRGTVRTRAERIFEILRDAAIKEMGAEQRP